MCNDRRLEKENKALGEIIGCKKNEADRPTSATKLFLEKYVILGEPKPTKGADWFFLHIFST